MWEHRLLRFYFQHFQLFIKKCIKETSTPLISIILQITLYQEISVLYKLKYTIKRFHYCYFSARARSRSRSRSRSWERDRRRSRSRDHSRRDRERDRSRPWRNKSPPLSSRRHERRCNIVPIKRNENDGFCMIRLFLSSVAYAFLTNIDNKMYFLSPDELRGVGVPRRCDPEVAMESSIGLDFETDHHRPCEHSP